MDPLPQAVLSVLIGHGVIDQDRIPYSIYQYLQSPLEDIQTWSDCMEGLELDKPRTWVNSITQTVDTLSETGPNVDRTVQDILGRWGYVNEIGFTDSFITSALQKAVRQGETETVFDNDDVSIRRTTFPDIPIDGFHVLEVREGGSPTFYTNAKVNDRIRESDYTSGDQPLDVLIEKYWQQIVEVEKYVTAQGVQKHIMPTKKNDKTRGNEGNAGVLFIEMSLSFTEELSFIGESSSYIDRWDRYVERKDDAHTVLLHGPPGTGKTTLAWDASTTIGDRIIYLAQDMVGESLEPAIYESDRFRPDVLLINDIDRMSKQNVGILIERLDFGVNADLVLMTSNHLEPLPRAVRRPGRIDQIIEIDHQDLNPEQYIQALIEQYDLDLSKQQHNRLRDMASEYSGAHLQELARRMDLFGEGISPLLDNDRTFDQEWLDERTPSSPKGQHHDDNDQSRA